MKNVTVNQCNGLENSLYAKSMIQNTEFVMIQVGVYFQHMVLFCFL